MVGASAFRLGSRFGSQEGNGRRFDNPAGRPQHPRRSAARAIRPARGTPAGRKPMQVLILCGGQGTRIRGVADDLPKPLVPIGDRPILWHIMKGYAASGHRDFVLLLGYRGDAIRRFFLDYAAMTSDTAVTLGPHAGVEVLARHCSEDWRVVLAETGGTAMTGARIFRGARYLQGDTFLATYGDGVSDIDLGRLVAFHRAHGKLATVTGVRPPGRFGELVTAGDRVTDFCEKPQLASGWINGGFFVFERAFVERYLRDDDSLVLEREPLMQAARDSQLMVYRHDGFWQPMDTYREWSMLNELWHAGRAPWKT
jgi:glucose-1-phosphate cytidylyltransferase